jgi:hypothetical protein
LHSHSALMANLHQAVGQCCGQPTPPLPSDTNNGNDGSSGSGQGAQVTAVGSIDPNDKVTVGYGSQNFVADGTRLFYIIHFENKSSASAAAQRVVVTDVLASELDWASLELNNIGFNQIEVPVPSGLNQYRTVTSVATDPNNTVVVDAALDPDSGQLTWVIESIDPLTQAPPEDPLAGFLPPNDAAHRGEGFVSYSVALRQPALHGQIITNKARIVFDANAPIDTPTVSNRVDLLAPVSAVQALPALSPPDFDVHWGGDDGAISAGLAGFDIYVSTNGAPFGLWLSQTTDTAARFSGRYGSEYRFYSVAWDHAGNVEANPSTTDAVTEVPTRLVALKNQGQVVIQWPSAPGQVYYIEVAHNLGAAGDWSVLAGPLTAAGTTMSYVDSNSVNRSYFRVKRVR